MAVGTRQLLKVDESERSTNIPEILLRVNGGTIGIWKRKSFLTAGTTWLLVVRWLENRFSI